MNVRGVTCGSSPGPSLPLAAWALRFLPGPLPPFGRNLKGIAMIILKVLGILVGLLLILALIFFSFAAQA